MEASWGLLQNCFSGPGEQESEKQHAWRGRMISTGMSPLPLPRKMTSSPFFPSFLSITLLPSTSYSITLSPFSYPSNGLQGLFATASSLTQEVALQWDPSSLCPNYLWIPEHTPGNPSTPSDLMEPQSEMISIHQTLRQELCIRGCTGGCRRRYWRNGWMSSGFLNFEICRWWDWWPNGRCR